MLVLDISAMIILVYERIDSYSDQSLICLHTPVAEVASAEVVKIFGFLTSCLVSKSIISWTEERFYKTGYFMSKHDFLSHLS